MNLDKWKSQIVRYIEYCILLMLDKKYIMGMRDFTRIEQISYNYFYGKYSISIVKKITKGKLLAINLARVHRGLATS